MYIYSFINCFLKSVTVLSDSFSFNTETGSNYITIHWRINDLVLQRELNFVRVAVYSGCQGGLQPTQIQSFNVAANQGNSVNITSLGKINKIRI